MKQVDEIIYDALKADDAIMELVGERIVSTCFEVSPTEADNTPLPNIIVTYDGMQNQISTKDELWEADEDLVMVSVDVAATSPDEVKTLVRKCRIAIKSYIGTMDTSGYEIPELESLTSNGLDWDWLRPCYYQRLTYQCIVPSDVDEDEQEEEVQTASS